MTVASLSLAKCEQLQLAAGQLQVSVAMLGLCVDVGVGIMC